MIQFGPDVCADRDRAMRLEWLETNGAGGFASSTIIGLNTRWYHGLLTTALSGPANRVLLLSRFEESVIAATNRYELASHRYPGALFGEGYCHPREFRLDPFPVFTFEVEGMEIEKRVFMMNGENTTVVEYELRTDGTRPSASCRIEIRPLFACRNYHGTAFSNHPILEMRDGMAVLSPGEGFPRIYLAHSDAALSAGSGYYNLECDEEQGLDFREDLFNPVTLKFSLVPGKTVAIIASAERIPAGRRHAESSAELRSREISRRKKIASAAQSRLPLARQPAAAFMVERGSQEVRRELPCFTGWNGSTGRDRRRSITV